MKFCHEALETLGLPNVSFTQFYQLSPSLNQVLPTILFIW